jgi:hypothetical protein
VSSHRCEFSGDAYTRPVDYYLSEINEYVRLHPQADRESIAALLERSKDRGEKQQKGR